MGVGCIVGIDGSLAHYGEGPGDSLGLYISRLVARIQGSSGRQARRVRQLAFVAG